MSELVEGIGALFIRLFGIEDVQPQPTDEQKIEPSGDHAYLNDITHIDDQWQHNQRDNYVETKFEDNGW